jgi:uncharacterized membrane protein YcaP (DUF421 family)
MILIIIRTLILYLVTLIALRIMGKRQIGQLQPYELVVIIMIAELAAIPMQNTGIPLLNGIIPIFILFASEVTLSYISLKSNRARGLICGKPSILIEKSKINEAELRRLRYNINELLEQLRLKNVSDITDVEYAILETSGQLSVILKSEYRPLQPRDMQIQPEQALLPVTLIIDGDIIQENIARINKSTEWLQQQLKKNGIDNINSVFLACLDSQGKLYFQAKSSS